jgi:flavin reductase (DIM6/NTAB) family NADH-FMN oxidoreductase RutF
MEQRLKEINVHQITDNVFKLIGTDWMLITAGSPSSYNTMTAGWGGLGVLWNKKVCFCFIRPHRYTYRFLENAEHFTLCFFEDQYRSVLEFCGMNSGRDVDKIAETGLTPVTERSGFVYFNESRLVLMCRKIYFQDLEKEHFLDPSILQNYPEKDYHRMYVGEILHCLAK